LWITVDKKEGEKEKEYSSTAESGKCGGQALWVQALWEQRT